jgi:hypothetical protein
MVMDKYAFTVELISFYKENLVSSADAVRRLAHLQKKYPEDYETIKQISYDPNGLPELLSKMDDETRGILVSIYLKQDTLSKKGITLFQMSSDEKKKYAEELEEFGKYVQSEIEKVAKKQEELS